MTKNTFNTCPFFVASMIMAAIMGGHFMTTFSIDTWTRWDEFGVEDGGKTLCSLPEAQTFTWGKMDDGWMDGE